MFDAWHHRKAYKKLLPKWFGPFVIRNVYADNGFYELENVDGSPYLNRINHEKLKKVLDMWFQVGIHNEFGNDVIWWNPIITYVII
jgi:hypothetical protein